MLGLEKLLTSESNLNSTVSDNMETEQNVVFDLACAILQLEQAVDQRYLKKPLAGK